MKGEGVSCERRGGGEVEDRVGTINGLIVAQESNMPFAEALDFLHQD